MPAGGKYNHHVDSNWNWDTRDTAKGQRGERHPSEVNTMKYQTQRSSLCVTGELSHLGIIFREDCYLNGLFQVKGTSQIKINFQ